MASLTAPNHSKTFTVADGTKYGYISIPAQPGKPTLLFLHGYPSSSYHWHNQVPQCLDSGYGMLAPDMLGYGDTSKPVDKAAYDNTILSGHVIELLDAENISTCVAVGHDWGSILLSTLARLHPERFSLLVFLAVGYIATQAPLTDIEAINKMAVATIGRPIYGYWLFHNRDDCAEIMESADPASTASLMFPADPNVWMANICEPGGMEAWIKEKKTTETASWITPDELTLHAKIIKTGGSTGPLNWYKQAMAGITHASELKINPSYAETKFDTPTLFVGCTKDVICVPAFQEAGMQGVFKDLTVESLDTGHWVMLEKPTEMWEIVSGWIEKKSK